MGTKIPTLSPDGWVGDIAKKADYVLSWFFEANYSQSVIFRGNVSSLQYLIQQHGSEPVLLVSSIKQALDRLLERYFDSFSVEVKEQDVEDSDKYGVLVNATVTENGVSHLLGKLVSVQSSKINKIVTYNNGVQELS